MKDIKSYIEAQINYTLESGLNTTKEHKHFCNGMLKAYRDILEEIIKNEEEERGEFSEEEWEFMKDGKRIYAISEYRQRNCCSLQEAMRVIGTAMAKMK